MSIDSKKSIKFKYLISIKPLGLMYGSAGRFLSPDNLVGRSGDKFPPDAATLSGLFFNAVAEKDRQTLKKELCVAGPFWSKIDNIPDIYVPIPRTTIIGEDQRDRWYLERDVNGQRHWQRDRPEVKSAYQWFAISEWQTSRLKNIQSATASPWLYTPFLHPKMELQERCSTASDGLFLENAVQLRDDVCLTYLSTKEIEADWYRFGGESHLVEVESHALAEDSTLKKLLKQEIKDAFALITPGVWSSNRFSYRDPQHKDFPKIELKLTGKPVFHRYRMGGRLGRGRYSVPAGSVYVLEKPFEQHKTWQAWPQDWFTPAHKKDLSLKHLGCGLCLPLTIKEQQVKQGVA